MILSVPSTRHVAVELAGHAPTITYWPVHSAAALVSISVDSATKMTWLLLRLQAGHSANRCSPGVHSSAECC